jgi:hypothetical protein
MSQQDQCALGREARGPGAVEPVSGSVSRSCQSLAELITQLRSVYITRMITAACIDRVRHWSLPRPQLNRRYKSAGNDAIGGSGYLSSNELERVSKEAILVSFDG